MTRRMTPILVLLATCWMGSVAWGQNTGAKSSGNWETASIWTGGSVPGSTNNVYIGSTTPSGAALTAAVTLTAAESAANVSVGFGPSTNGTLALGGNKLTISGSLSIGQSGGTGTITEGGGSFTAQTLQISSGNSFSFGASDAVTTVQLTGASSVTTSATGNIVGGSFTGSTVETGSTLNLGANLNLNGGQLSVTDSGSTLNMNGHNITADTLLLGWNGTSAVTLSNRGALDVTNLFVGNNQTFNINAGDTVGNYSLGGGMTTLGANITTLGLSSGAVGTTTASGSMTGGSFTQSNVQSGSTLNLGANLNIDGGALNVQDSGSTLNMNGHGLTAASLYLGWNGTSAVTVTNAGLVTVTDLFVGNGTDVTLHGGDVVNNSINLKGNSVLTVQQVNNTGLTLNGTSLSDLTIDPSSMDLIFNLDTSANWDFRWKDPSSGNWISTLQSMIISGQIVISSPDGYSVVDQGGYTYIMGGTAAAVPEPSTLVLAGIAGVGIMLAAARRRRRGR